MKKRINEIVGMFGITFQMINQELCKLGDAHISDVGENCINVSMNLDTVNMHDVIAIMERYGFEYYDNGACEDRVILTFRFKGCTESKKSNKKRINEAQLRAIVRESVKRVLNEIGQDDVSKLDSALRDLTTLVYKVRGGDIYCFMKHGVTIADINTMLDEKFLPYRAVKTDKLDKAMIVPKNRYMGENRQMR